MFLLHLTSSYIRARSSFWRQQPIHSENFSLPPAWIESITAKVHSFIVIWSQPEPLQKSVLTQCVIFWTFNIFTFCHFFLLTTLKTIVIFLVGCLHGFSKSTWISLRTQAKVFPFVKIYISYISGESISVSRNLYFTSESVSLLILKYTCSATSLMRNVPQSQIIVSWNREVVKSSKTFVTLEHWTQVRSSLSCLRQRCVLPSHCKTKRQKKKKAKRKKEKKAKRQRELGGLFVESSSPLANLVHPAHSAV